MDDQHFDALIKRLGAHTSRRSLMKALLGLGGIVTTGAVLHDQTDAARRGFSGPSFPLFSTPTPTPTPVCIADLDPCTMATAGECCAGNGCCIAAGQSVGECLPANAVCLSVCIADYGTCTAATAGSCCAQNGCCIAPGFTDGFCIPAGSACSIV